MNRHETELRLKKKNRKPKIDFGWTDYIMIWIIVRTDGHLQGLCALSGFHIWCMSICSLMLKEKALCIVSLSGITWYQWMPSLSNGLDHLVLDQMDY